MVQVSENLPVRDRKSAKNILPHSSLSQQTSKVLKENLPNYNNTMEFPPSNWDIFPVEELVTAAPIIENLRALPNRSVISAAVRWAVCISEDQHLEIQLQSLPAPVTTLNSKPIFKR